MGFVYMITNTVNQKHYIGISIHEPVNGRIKRHLAGYGGNRLLTHALKKYGKESFTYEILEQNVFPDLLPSLEVSYIAKLNTVAPHGYNLTTGGDGGKVPCEETRKKMSKSQKGRKHTEVTKRKISEKNKGEKNPNYNKTASEETRRKMSRRRKGRKLSQKTRQEMSERQKGEKNHFYGKNLSKEHKRKLSEANTGIKKHTEESKRRIAESRQRPEFKQAYKFYLTLPNGLDTTKRIKLLRAEFPNIPQTTIYRWANTWEKGKLNPNLLPST